MNPYENQIRTALAVALDATVEDILNLIRDEGWTPKLISTEIDEKTVWACPVSKGIFTTVEVDPKTGMKGHAGRLSPEIAALEGLRKARGWPPMKKQVDQFVVVTEAGQEETIYVYKDMIDASTMSEPGKVIEGKLREHRTSDGCAVNVLSEDTYEILYPLGNMRATKKS